MLPIREPCNPQSRVQPPYYVRATSPHPPPALLLRALRCAALSVKTRIDRLRQTHVHRDQLGRDGPLVRLVQRQRVLACAASAAAIPLF
jgi:hypothetical protein